MVSGIDGWEGGGSRGGCHDLDDMETEVATRQKRWLGHPTPQLEWTMNPAAIGRQSDY
jgi:hypothetical protein